MERESLTDGPFPNSFTLRPVVSPQPILRNTNGYHDRTGIALPLLDSPPVSPRTKLPRGSRARARHSVTGQEFEQVDEGLSFQAPLPIERIRPTAHNQRSSNEEQGSSQSSLRAIDIKQERQTPPVLHRLPMSNPKPLQPLEDANILATYGPAKKRLFLFDYDGTLADIVQNPNKAVIPDNLVGWLQTLASCPKNIVWVISGRDQGFLHQRLERISGIGLVAEHGAFMRRPGCDTWEDLAAKSDLSWQSKVKKAFNEFADEVWGAYIEEKKVALVLHYRLANYQDLVALQVASLKESLERELQKWPVEIINGKCVLEARPANFDKGQIVQRITDEVRHETGGPPDFILCIGDDTTDEGISCFHLAYGILLIAFRYVSRSSCLRSPQGICVHRDSWPKHKSIRCRLLPRGPNGGICNDCNAQYL